jgi:hypothetical protein
MSDENETVGSTRLFEPTIEGIRQCLNMLAEEAASLRLDGTLDAIEAAVRACDAELFWRSRSVATGPAALGHLRKPH